ncbi:MAG: hypothetical protein H7338_22290, partial [Candidatus Sericytochromatia bacterium]|nr:hypothetical protein [Candidatus Sericytochromatia bacterium]
LVALFSASRRGWALRILPALWGLFGLTFWLGGGEVSQLDGRGMWRTNARGAADEFIAWKDIRSVELLPFVWHQRDPQTGLDGKLGLRLIVRPATGYASQMTVKPDTNLLELANVLDANRTKTTAERPDGLIASLYRWHPQAPQAILLGQYMKPEPKPTVRPSIAPVSPTAYQWVKRRHQMRVQQQ